MRSSHLTLILASALAGLSLTGCATPAPGAAADDSNPFLDLTGEGKDDTAYQNPDGVEVEVDFEADVEASSYQIRNAPAQLGQYALTYLSKRGEVYLESIAEDATSRDRVEWLVDGTWVSAQAAASLPTDKLHHFRIRGMNAVLLHSASADAHVGNVLEAVVPVRPYDVMRDASDKCADPDNHLGLSQSIYWYMWNPDRAGCMIATERATITVSRTFDAAEARYPEYDRLLEDGKITAVVLFGQIGDGAVSQSDPGMTALNRMARDLTAAGFQEVPDAPLGRRFSKHAGAVELVYDLYSPFEFSGLGDSGHFGNFQRALSEHEIVVYDGHSMLGASDFWARPTYPSFYQIFLYGGCLGYEYYVQPIVEGKGGWENVDIMSSVVEVSADANRFAAPVLAKLEYAVTHDNAVAWADLLRAVRTRVGDSTFGVSGARDNCYTPTGSRCGGPPPPPPTDMTHRWESTSSVEIPDNLRTGATSVIDVPDALTARSLSIELDVTHTYVGDLRIELSHGGTTATVWNRTGGGTDDIHQTIALPTFAGASTSGAWTLTVADMAAQDVGTVNRWALVATL